MTRYTLAAIAISNSLGHIQAIEEEPRVDERFHQSTVLLLSGYFCPHDRSKVSREPTLTPLLGLGLLLLALGRLWTTSLARRQAHGSLREGLAEMSRARRGFF